MTNIEYDALFEELRDVEAELYALLEEEEIHQGDSRVQCLLEKIDDLESQLFGDEEG